MVTLVTRPHLPHLPHHPGRCPTRRVPFRNSRETIPTVLLVDTGVDRHPHSALDRHPGAHTPQQQVSRSEVSPHPRNTSISPRFLGGFRPLGCCIYLMYCNSDSTLLWADRDVIQLLLAGSRPHADSPAGALLPA